MHPQERSYFDRQLEQVLEKLPPRIHEVLAEVPLYVEDRPSAKMLKSLGLDHPQDLQGLYSGVALPDRSVQQSGILSDVIYLFREGILDMARDDDGRLDEAELREQIRITILHEVGHYHGLDEDDLEGYGYG